MTYQQPLLQTKRLATLAGMPNLLRSFSSDGYKSLQALLKTGEAMTLILMNKKTINTDIADGNLI